MDTEFIYLKNILLVEDDPRDWERTLAALEEHQLANKVAAVENGAEGPEHLRRREKIHNPRGRQSHCRVARQQDADGLQGGWVVRTEPRQRISQERGDTIPA